MVLKLRIKSSIATQRRITALAARVLTVLTRHHQSRCPEQVGMFAGSLLPRDGWDHP
jgi:hypothetical protein